MRNLATEIYKKLMRKSFFYIVALTLLTAVGCVGNKTDQGADKSKAKDSDTIVVDSTLYGKVALDEMGGETFAFLPDSQSTVLTLDRGDNNIFGDYEGSHENDRWALTINKKGTPDASVAQAINVTQVREFTRAFHIVNGQLVLDDSTFVQVLSMDDDSLVFKDLKTGKRDRFYRSAE
jgi:putative lipoprotein